jgi:ureidoglycolate lyase
MGRKPEPVFLQPGQKLKAGVAGLGEQMYKTVAA